MPDPQFNGLRKRLLSGGVAPRYIERTLLELRDHYSDIAADALSCGATLEDAAALARSTLGDEEAIATAVLARTELHRWSRQHPRTAACLNAVSLVLVMPAVPVMYCAYRGSSIVRWSTSVSLASLVTASILLGLQALFLT